MSNSLQPHEPQYARPPCPSPTPGVHSKLCPLCRQCHPTISSSVVSFSSHPSIFPSIRVFSNKSALCIRWQKYWSLSFNISPSNEHPGLISFRMDCLDLLAAQGTLKSLLQHHSSKASILRCLSFFIVQLSHPYMTTGKTIGLTRWTFAGKVMSLLFNMLSRLVIAFLPRSKCLLISWLPSPSAVILEPRKIKSATVSTVSPSICHEVTYIFRRTKIKKMHSSIQVKKLEGCVYAQSCLILFNPMDSSPPVSSVHRSSPGNNSGMDCHFLLQGFFLTQGLNPCLLCFLH